MKIQFSAGLIAFLMLACGLAMAESAQPNTIGLYTNMEGTGDTDTQLTGEDIELYLVMTQPRDYENGNVPCTTYTGFHMNMNFDPLPAGNLLLLDIDQPGDPLDIGINDFPGGVLNFVSAHGDPQPIVDDAYLLATITFRYLGTEPINVYLGPGSGGYPAETEIVYLGGHDGVFMYNKLSLNPASGSHDLPVFTFNGRALAEEQSTLGSLKALYR
jgi:hypothetical protein